MSGARATHVLYNSYIVKRDVLIFLFLCNGETQNILADFNHSQVECYVISE